MYFITLGSDVEEIMTPHDYLYYQWKVWNYHKGHNVCMCMVHVCVHAFLCECVYLCVPVGMLMCMPVCMLVNIICVCLCVCLHLFACLQVYVYGCVCIYVYWCESMCVCQHLCAYVWQHACMFSYFNRLPIRCYYDRLLATLMEFDSSTRWTSCVIASYITVAELASYSIYIVLPLYFAVVANCIKQGCYENIIISLWSSC